MSGSLMELDKLELYLSKNGFKYKRIDEDGIDMMLGGRHRLVGGRHQIIVNEGEPNQWDAICHYGSYGYEDGLLEIMGDTVVRNDDEVEGWLTANDIIKRLEEK